jgi:hypothetical protein
MRFDLRLVVKQSHIGELGPTGSLIGRLVVQRLVKGT